MEDFFVAQKQDLIYISLGCLFILLVGSFFIYKVEIQKAYRSLGAYRVLVSMLLFFVAFIALGIGCFNLFNYISLRPIVVSEEGIQYKKDMFEWKEVRQIKKEAFKTVDAFGKERRGELVLRIVIEKREKDIIVPSTFYDIDGIMSSAQKRGKNKG